MGDTAVLRRVPGGSELRLVSGSRNEKEQKGTDLVYWSGELPRRLTGYLDRVSPWNLRMLSAVVVEYAEVRELANVARLLHQVIRLGNKRASEGRWKFGEAQNSLDAIKSSIRRLQSQVQEAAKKGRIFINSDHNSPAGGHRHA